MAKGNQDNEISHQIMFYLEIEKWTHVISGRLISSEEIRKIMSWKRTGYDSFDIQDTFNFKYFSKLTNARLYILDLMTSASLNFSLNSFRLSLLPEFMLAWCFIKFFIQGQQDSIEEVDGPLESKLRVQVLCATGRKELKFSTKLKISHWILDYERHWEGE